MILYADVGGTNTRLWAEGKGKVTRLIIGMRGVWTSSEKSAWKKRLRHIAPTVTVLSDIELAHWRMFGNKPGIMLNAGTGSIALGKNGKGKTVRAGGLGPLFGDAGSAFWIGKEYLRQFPERARAYAVGKDPIKRIAAVAKTVLKRAAKNPKSVERKIVLQAQTHLRALIKEVKGKLGQKNSPPVRVTGGLFENKLFNDLWRK